jgi:hypothetical protein
LVVTDEGSLEVTSEGHTTMAKAPCVVLVLAHTVHSVRNKFETLLKCVHIVVTLDQPAA